MKKMCLALCATLLFIASNAQILREQTSPQTIASQVPGFSEVSSINTVNVSYTPQTPISYPDPVDGDTTTENPDIYDYGSILPVNFSLSDGNLTTTSLGKVWTLRISIPNALSIGLTFTQFNLSSSAEMYIYNDARTVLNYQIKKEHFVNSDIVSVSSINGNAITIYLIEPGNFGTFQSALTIGEVIAGYQPIEDVGNVGNNNARYGTGCMPDIRCYPQYMTSARAVGRFSSGNGFGGTGTLINNENNDGRAYFLTAFHVLDVNRNWLGRPAGNGVLDADEIAALQRATFQFQFWRTECNSYTNNPVAIQFSGAIVRAANHASDMVLLELINPPGIGDGVNYAGWSRQTSASSNSGSYIIHHPEGKNMRLTQTRDVGSYLNANFWDASYSSGAVTGGSSGSALFSENGQIIGQLKGGWSSCLTPRWNDRYGKFYRSWNDGGLQQWLSPVQGLQSIATLDLTNIWFTGPDEIASCMIPAQYSCIKSGLAGVTYTWAVSLGLQIVSGQGTSNVIIEALPGVQNRAETITLTLASPTKGRIRTYTIQKNVTVATDAGFNGYYYKDGVTYNELLDEVKGSNYLIPSRWTIIHATSSVNGTPQWTPVGGYNYSWTISSNELELNLQPGGYVAFDMSIATACGIKNDTYVFEPDEGYGYYTMAPNPATSDVTIYVDNEKIKKLKLEKSNDQTIQKIILMNKHGVVVLEQLFPADTKKANLNISSLNPDVYFIRIFNGRTWTVLKLIKK